jgi:hypothetical protein
MEWVAEHAKMPFLGVSNGYGVPGVAEANTDVTAWSGVTITGHQKGKSLHPSVSFPFWRNSIRTGS